MNQSAKAKAERFRLPRYEELPDGGLYLEQTARYISDQLAPLQIAPVTGSMISNYVKKDLVDNPIKKQYFPDQIARLIFISAAKAVLSMEGIGVLLALQKRSFDNRRAYNSFCLELENAVACAFGSEKDFDVPDGEDEGRELLRDVVIVLAHKAKLSRSIAQLRQEH